MDMLLHELEWEKERYLKRSKEAIRYLPGIKIFSDIK